MILLLAAVCLGGYGFHTIITIDGFGYWGNAAFLSGLDWSDLMGQTYYYSFGYSLLLCPILLLFAGSAHLYFWAVALNGVMLCAIYLLLLQICQYLLPHKSRWWHIFISLVLVACPYYIAYTQETLSEIPLSLFYTGIVYLFIRFVQKPTILHSILLALANTYLFTIHMRALGVPIAVAMMLVLLLVCKKVPLRTVVAFALSMAVAVVGTVVLKNYLTTYLYSPDYGAVNNFSSVASSVSTAFAFDKIFAVLKRVCGQIFYFSVASGGVFLVGFYALVRNVAAWYQYPKSRKCTSRGILSLFVMLCALAEIGISALYMISATRLDMVIYGRYAEFAALMVVLFGLCELVARPVPAPCVAVLIGAFAACAAVVNMEFAACGSTAFYHVNAVGVCSYFQSPVNPGVAVWKAGFVTVILLLLLLSVARLIEHPKMICRYLALGVALAVTVFLGYNGYTYNELHDRLDSEYYAHTSPIVDLCDNLSFDENIVQLYTEDWECSNENTSVYIKFLQFQLPNIPIESQRVTDIAQYSFQPNRLYLVINSSDTYDMVSQYLFPICRSDMFTVLATEDSAYYAWKQETAVDDSQHIPLSTLFFNRNNLDRISVAANIFESNPDNPNAGVAITGVTTEEREAVWGPYRTFEAGTYQVTFHVNAKTTAENIGRLRVTAQLGAWLLDEAPLTSAMLDDAGNAEVTLTFSTDGSEEIETPIYLYDGVDFTLRDITYTKVADSYALLNSKEQYLKEITTLVNMAENSMPVYVVQSAVEAETVNIDNLKNILPGHTVRSALEQNVNAQTPSFVLVSTQKQRYVLSLLPKYTILTKIGGYTLLVSSAATDITTAYEQAGRFALSRGNSISALYFAGAAANAQGYTIKPPSGVYRVRVDVTYSSAVLSDYGTFGYIAGEQENVTTTNITAENTTAGKFTTEFEIQLPEDKNSASFSLPCNASVHLLQNDIFLERTGDYVEPLEEVEAES
ncbi:MAG: hypothetical protein PHO10_03010 [Gemmiger sp.]|nr:hypothetical protein [Gemmiger sp.]